MTETAELEKTNAVSTKRQVAAVVAATTVTVVLGVIANGLIDKVATRVRETIVPKTETDSE